MATTKKGKAMIPTPLFDELWEALYALNRAIYKNEDANYPVSILDLLSARDNIWSCIKTMDPTVKD